MMTPPWHTREAGEIAAVLETGPGGLSSAEANRRLGEYGPNAIETDRPSRWYETLVRQFRSPVIYILLICAAVTVLLREYIDATVIAAVVVLNAALGYFQERRAEASVRALMQLVSPQAHVIRDGNELDIESARIVPGDLVIVESGVRVPADVRLIAVNNLQADESMLTGESLPAAKATAPLAAESLALGDRKNLVYAGSTITTGRGRGYVVATGMQTELGKIAGHMRATPAIATPMQERMAQFARIIGIVVGAASIVAFGLGVALGEAPREMFTVAVALAVAAIPEGLPIAFTVTLALGVRRMASRNAIVRRLPAVETLGSTTIVGSDKTGTLTENRMTVRDMWAGHRLFRFGEHGLHGVDGEPDPSPLAEHRPLYLALLAGVMTNEAEIHPQSTELAERGDPTETALLYAALNAGMEPAEARRSQAIVRDLPFESERRFSASTREREGSNRTYYKGAPERILEMSSLLLGEDGEEPLDRDSVAAAAADMASRGLRVLGLAYRDDPDDIGEVPTVGLTFVGLAGLLDPPRPGVMHAIEGCRRAGIRVVMITGDHASTALAIGRELGIADQNSDVLSGPEIQELSDHDLDHWLNRTSVIARAAPEHKLRVVQSFRRRGEVVAVTGDGVNDAPALRAADIGVAMGKGGTDVAREAADMVLADDNFVSIYAAVEEGRITFDNIRKVTFFLISTGAASIVAILGAVLLGWPIPMVAAQLLWLNLVTNGLQDIALAFEPGEKGVLARRPRGRTEGILSNLLWERTVIAGLVMGVGTLLVFRWQLDRTDSLVAAQTAALTTMVLFQLFHVGNSRSTGVSVFRKNPTSNPFLFVATIASVGVHVSALYLPPTQYVLRVEPLAAEAWLVMGAVAASVIVAVEAHKLLRRARVREGWRDPAPAGG